MARGCRIRGDIGPARNQPAASRRLPAEAHRFACDLRRSTHECRGRGRPASRHFPRIAPDRGAWQATWCCPAPWPVASSLGSGRGMLFKNLVVGSHTQQASAQCGSGIVHPRTWTLFGSRGACNGFRGVVTQGLRASRDARGSDGWDHGPHRNRGRVGVSSFLRGARREAGPDRRGQAPKGTGGMPRRHQMVGVEGRDRSGGAAQRASIPEFPLDTRGTETSQYPQEKKSTETPSVAASERGRA